MFFIECSNWTNLTFSLNKNSNMYLFLKPLMKLLLFLLFIPNVFCFVIAALEKNPLYVDCVHRDIFSVWQGIRRMGGWSAA